MVSIQRGIVTGKGIVMTYYNPSPLDSILSIGRRIRSREVMEKEDDYE